MNHKTLFLTCLQSCWIFTLLSSISWTSSPKALPSSQSYQNNEKGIIYSWNWEGLKDKDFTLVSLVQQEKAREGEQKAVKRESKKSNGGEGRGGGGSFQKATSLPFLCSCSLSDDYHIPYYTASVSQSLWHNLFQQWRSWIRQRRELSTIGLHNFEITLILKQKLTKHTQSVFIWSCLNSSCLIGL